MPRMMSLVFRIGGPMLTAVLPSALLAADLQIEHVTIVSPERLSPMRDARVRVHDGRIISVSSAAGVAQPDRGTKTLDGTNLFLNAAH